MGNILASHMGNRLVSAVEDKKVDEVEALLKSGASPDACGSDVCY